jgi:signal transduction histidine kinase
VKDNVRGISLENQRQIFEKFFQAPSQNTRKPTGSELGLAISKKIVEHQKGKIWVQSSFNEGSKFSILLPVNKNGLQHEQEIIQD